MKQSGYCVLLAAAIALAYGSAVWAAESTAAPAKPEAKAAPASAASSNAIGVTLTGKNYCPEKRYGAMRIPHAVLKAVAMR